MLSLLSPVSLSFLGVNNRDSNSNNENRKKALVGPHQTRRKRKNKKESNSLLVTDELRALLAAEFQLNFESCSSEGERGMESSIIVCCTLSLQLLSTEALAFFSALLCPLYLTPLLLNNCSSTLYLLIPPHPLHIHTHTPTHALQPPYASTAFSQARFPSKSSFPFSSTRPNNKKKKRENIINQRANTASATNTVNARILSFASRLTPFHFPPAALLAQPPTTRRDVQGREDQPERRGHLEPERR